MKKIILMFVFLFVFFSFVFISFSFEVNAEDTCLDKSDFCANYKDCIDNNKLDCFSIGCAVDNKLWDDCPECAKSDDCDTGYSCVDNICKEQNCEKDIDCIGNNNKCDLKTKTCYFIDCIVSESDCINRGGSVAGTDCMFDNSSKIPMCEDDCEGDGDIDCKKQQDCQSKGGVLLGAEDGAECPHKTDELVDGCCIRHDCENPTQEMIDNCECGVKLNTMVPFIGDCIQISANGTSKKSDGTILASTSTAFPLLIGGLSKILVTAILVFSFILIIVAGVMMTTGGINQQNFTKGQELIMKVIAGLALLGASGIILHLINPSFFG